MWLLSRCATTDSLTGLSASSARLACTLRVVVLMRDIEHIGADDAGHLAQDGGQTLGIVGLVDVRKVFILRLLAGGVADVVNIEAQRFGEVVEALELQFPKRTKQIQFPIPPAGEQS